MEQCVGGDTGSHTSDCVTQTEEARDDLYLNVSDLSCFQRLISADLTSPLKKQNNTETNIPCIEEYKKTKYG